MTESPPSSRSSPPGAPPEAGEVVAAKFRASRDNRERVREIWRLRTAYARMLPSLLIIGTMRGGTTSLFEWLCQHPRIRRPATKEPHFFTTGYRYGSTWYRSRFPLRSPGFTTLEASATTLFHPLAPRRVASDLPSTARFVALLREPVSRLLSQYAYYRAQGLESASLEEALRRERRHADQGRRRALAGEVDLGHDVYSYVGLGLYAEQLSRWFDVIDRNRILVLASEELFTRPHETLERVTRWMGWSPFRPPVRPTNSAPALEVDAHLVRHLRQQYAEPNERLFDLLGARLWSNE